MIEKLSTTEKIKLIMDRDRITTTELAARMDLSRQALSNKFSRGKFTEQDLYSIAEALGYELNIEFIKKI